MSIFDKIISYVMLLSLAFLIGSIGHAIGIPWYITGILGGLLGWKWSKIDAWIEKKMKVASQWLINKLM